MGKEQTTAGDGQDQGSLSVKIRQKIVHLRRITENIMQFSKALFEDGRKLPVVEEFYSLQGEGFHVGKAAWFLRIGGCDVGCSWCDTKFSWNPDLHPVVDTDLIIRNIIDCPARAVVVTGGEPLIFDLDYLCDKLKEHGIETFLETSGSHPLTGQWDWICLSPKPQLPPLPEIYPLASELKIIVSGQDDFEWAVENSGLVSDECQLYLQPEWSVYGQVLPSIVDFIKENPSWKISLQAHKFMHIP
jgi:7-carboxy-7-deazaguanine synthase